MNNGERPAHWTEDQTSENVWKIVGGLHVAKMRCGDILIFIPDRIGGVSISAEQASRIDGIANPTKRYTGGKDCAVCKH